MRQEQNVKTQVHIVYDLVGENSLCGQFAMAVVFFSARTWLVWCELISAQAEQAAKYAVAGADKLDWFLEIHRIRLRAEKSV